MRDEVLSSISPNATGTRSSNGSAVGARSDHPSSRPATSSAASGKSVAKTWALVPMISRSSSVARLKSSVVEVFCIPIATIRLPGGVALSASLSPASDPDAS